MLNSVFVLFVPFVATDRWKRRRANTTLILSIPTWNGKQRTCGETLAASLSKWAARRARSATLPARTRHLRSLMRDRTFTPKRQLVVTTVLRSMLHTSQCLFRQLMRRPRSINHDKTFTRRRSADRPCRDRLQVSASRRNGLRCWPTRQASSGLWSDCSSCSSCRAKRERFVFTRHKRSLSTSLFSSCRQYSVSLARSRAVRWAVPCSSWQRLFF